MPPVAAVVAAPTVVVPVIAGSVLAAVVVCVVVVVVAVVVVFVVVVCVVVVAVVVVVIFSQQCFGLLHHSSPLRAGCSTNGWSSVSLQGLPSTKPSSELAHGLDGSAEEGPSAQAGTR